MSRTARSSGDDVATTLRAFAVELASEGVVQTQGAFTDLAPADALVRSDPNAFLIAVLFTQGISAERAWAAPYLLSQRLGHLDLARLAEEPDAVREAIARPPALHRFVNHVPCWVTSAARRLLDCYDGDASAIWPDGSHFRDVVGRLNAFAGIGQKKAVMATDMLVRHLGVGLIGREHGEVAYDVQVRRVFLRAGLVTKDDPTAVAAAARNANPDDPAALDLPAWIIGRTWCRPRAPRCDECRLNEVCPRLTHLDAPGVGVRRGPER